MRKTDETQAEPKRDRAWFERTVAELKAELEKLPADRQEELMRGTQGTGLTGRGNQRFEEDFWISPSPRWLFRGLDPEHSTSNRGAASNSAENYS